MEKLIELLKFKDGYDEVEYKKQSDGGYMFWLDGMAYREERICSKKFGFIERLVKNDKIKLDFGFIYHTYDEDELGEKYSDLDSLIMYLSIKDNPIEYLCSILKE